MTHTVTHTATVPNGKNDIFPNTMDRKSEDPITFQNFLKRKIYDRLALCDIYNLSRRLRQATGEVLLVFFFLLGDALRYKMLLLIGIRIAIST